MSLEQHACRCALDDAPRIHHRHLVGASSDDGEIVRDQHHGHAARPALARQQLEDLRLDSDIERRRRLVGNEQARRAGKRDGDCDALAHAARHLVRVVARAPLGLGDAELASSVTARAAASCGPRPRCSRSASAIWPPTVSTGLSDVIGSWKTTAISRPRSRRNASRGNRKSSRPSKRTAAAHARITGQQLQHRA